MKQECPPSAGDDSAPAWNAADTPLLSVRQLGRAFPAGEGTVAVLQFPAVNQSELTAPVQSSARAVSGSPAASASKDAEIPYLRR